MTDDVCAQTAPNNVLNVEFYEIFEMTSCYALYKENRANAPEEFENLRNYAMVE